MNHTSPTGTVYFVCRSEYEAPLGHRIVTFEADSVMDWFQRHWPDESFRKRILNPDLEDATAAHIEKLLEGYDYDMNSVWKAMARWGAVPPRNEKEFSKFIASIDYYGGPVAHKEHGVQVSTDDDEIEIAWYLFDEEFLEENPHRVSYLIRENWKLPEEFDASPGPEIDAPFVELNPDGDREKGSTYCVLLSSQDGETLRDITGTFRFQGVRMPELAGFLGKAQVPMKKRKWSDDIGPSWPEELLLTRALIHETGAKAFDGFLETVGESQSIAKLWTSSRIVSDTNFKDVSFLTGDAQKNGTDLVVLSEKIEQQSQSNSYWIYGLEPLMIQASPHMCQVRFHEKVRTTDDEADLAHDNLKTFIFFDDLWIAANPVLAESILHYAAGWDVLFEVDE